MIAREHLDERQGRLLNLLTALFEQRPIVDTTSAARGLPVVRKNTVRVTGGRNHTPILSRYSRCSPSRIDFDETRRPTGRSWR
jgi:hypothetical protein